MSKCLLVFCFVAVSCKSASCLRLHRSLTRLPFPLNDACSFYDGVDTIYLAGGFHGQGSNPDGGFSRAIFKYCPASDIIQQVQELPEDEHMGEGINILGGADDTILLVGGQTGIAASSSILILNKTDLSLVSLNNSCIPENGRSFLSAVPLNNETALLLGGMRFKWIPTNEAIAINRVTGEATVLGNLQVADRATALTAATGKNENEINLFYGAIEASSGTMNLIASTYIVDQGVVTRPHIYLDITAAYEIRPLLVVSDAQKHYIVGGIGGAGNINEPGIYEISKDLSNVVFHPVEGFFGGSSSRWFGTSTGVYVEKLNRIYIFGGVSAGDDVHQHLDTIAYIDLNELRDTK